MLPVQKNPKIATYPLALKRPRAVEPVPTDASDTDCDVAVAVKSMDLQLEPWAAHAVARFAALCGIW